MHHRGITFRTDLRPGDIGTIVNLHGVIYAQEQGWDATFEAYVAGPLADFALSLSTRQRLWIAEKDNGAVGCVGIVEAAPTIAQLRWFLVLPIARGIGLGRELLGKAIAFCREAGYVEIVLRTEKSLDAAAHLYRSFGFRLIESKPGRMWGVEVVEEKYLLKLV